MDCRTAHDHLSAYLDHAVPAATREVLDDHLGACPRCRRELTQLQTVMAWVRDLPTIEPSPSFLQEVRERVEHISRRSPVPFFRRLAGVLPLQVAAVVLLAVSTVLLFQMTPQVWQRRTRQIEPAARIEPQTTRERTLAPAFEAPLFEQMPEELAPPLAPLVHAPAARPVFTLREEPLRTAQEQPGMSMLVRLQPERRASELTAFPSVILWAADPIQAAQQVSELAPRVGGALLEPRGIATRAGRISRGPVHVALSIAPDRYQALLDGIRQLPDTTVVEERVAFIGREVWQGPSTSTFLPEHPLEAPIPRFTLVITILPR